MRLRRYNKYDEEIVKKAFSKLPIPQNVITTTTVTATAATTH